MGRLIMQSLLLMSRLLRVLLVCLPRGVAEVEAERQRILKSGGRVEVPHAPTHPRAHTAARRVLTRPHARP